MNLPSQSTLEDFFMTQIIHKESFHKVLHGEQIWPMIYPRKKSYKEVILVNQKFIRQ